jgi:hypothetical protein
MERQTIATEKAAGAAKKGADISESAMKIVEAADILIQSTGLVPAGPIAPDSHIAIVFKNFGRTRAENVRSYIAIVIPGVPNSELSPDTFSIGPNGTQLVGFLKFSRFLNQETFRKIESGAIPLKFAGKVTYDDRFGESHVLECKGVLDPKTGTFVLGDFDPRKENDQEAAS